MYDTNLTNIALPDDKDFIYHLSVAISVFISINEFIIENILHTNKSDSWYDLIDKESGKLLSNIKNTITKNSNTKIAQEFEKCINKRNSIIHSFRCTYNNKQVIYTKDKQNKQHQIDDKFLLDFIADCSNLYNMLDTYRNNLSEEDNQ